ncbi:DUF4250 domain-containing protein [Pseudoflavonifractor phocaeensis]|uniref:DUF4250 domain-containing protein n=1 Tax=Pseudoflavonifractor phocaeensis TaxID=1870988 RepID=UPI00195D0A90|nr:DUF4250 domain-containing protein [Pseudoflavonifractor phocaeensis]MBM6924669.1 DUF4250 domain-containing protein [Pseudoflavonifractor phocaeensis]
MLPQDPVLLLSVVNTKLRDCYANLDDLCDDLQADQSDLCQRLAQLGYRYATELNQFTAC